MKKTKKHICFVYHDLHVGGVQKELIAMLSSLDQMKFTVTLVLTHYEGELKNAIPTHVHVIEVKGNSLLPDITYLFSLKNKLSVLKPDLVIGFMQDINLSLLLVKKIFRFSFKVVCSEDVVLSEWEVFKKTSHIKNVLTKLLYKTSDACIAPSHTVLDDLQKNYSVKKENTFFIPNFIELLASRYKDRHKMGLQFFLFVGRFDEQKNIPLLIRSFASLIRDPQYHTIRLALIGRDETGTIKALVNRLNISKNVVFLGHVDQPYKYFRTAKALILPSKVEGFPRVSLYAKAARCPLIMSNFAGSSEITAHLRTGLIFDMSKSQELHACMKLYLMREDIARTHAEAAHEEYLKVYGSRFKQAYEKKVNTFFSQQL